MRPRADILIVSVGGTIGWRHGSRRLAAAFTRAGARVAHVEVGPGPRVRTLMATDLVQALAARRAARHAPDATATVYCSVTAALLWPRPGAIWLDAIAAENRPGRHGLWQRATERRRLAQAPLIMTWDGAALDALGDRPHADAITVPPPLQPPGAAAPTRDIDVLVYAADPVKRRLEHVLGVWRRVRRGNETLTVAGLAGADEPGVRYAGRLEPAAYRELVRRARVFAAAPRREDFGIAALEALADGAMLATTPAPGAYPALALARALDPRLVSDDLGAGIRAALDAPSPGYAERAGALLAPYALDAVAATLGDRVLPRLVPGWRV